MPNSGAGSGGELFKGSKDSANIYSDFPSHVLFNDLILVTLSRPAAFEDSHAITTRSHVAVCTRNSCRKWWRAVQRLKRLGKSSGLHSKKILLRGVRIFCE